MAWACRQELKGQLGQLLQRRHGDTVEGDRRTLGPWRGFGIQREYIVVVGPMASAWGGLGVECRLLGWRPDRPSLSCPVRTDGRRSRLAESAKAATSASAVLATGSWPGCGC